MRLRAMLCQSVLILFLLGGSACSPLASVLRPNDPRLSEILQISKIRSIQLRNGWDGLSPFAPTEAHYSLQPGATAFSGQANFSIGGNFDIKEPITETQNIEIPLKNIQAFLDKLAACPFSEGEYQPSIEWTDDYPSLKIEIELQTGSITFYSSSQGTSHVPWAMYYNDKTYVVDSSAPMAALAELDPYLETDRLNALINQAQNSLSHQPTSVPVPTSTP